MFNGPVFNNEVVQANSRAVNNAGFSESLDEANSLYSRLTGASFELVPSSYKGGVVYSGVPNTGNGDITWTRGSDAWRTNADGLIQRVPWNLFTQSIWSGGGALPTGWNYSFNTGSSTPTTSIYGIGSAYSFSTSGTRQVFNQSLNYISGNTYSLSIRVESVSGTIAVSDIIFFNGGGTLTYFEDGASVSASKAVVAGKTYTTVIACNTTATQQVRVGSGCTASTTGTVVLSQPQLIDGSTTTPYFPTTDRLNVPRLSYMYGSCPALLLEPQRTNLGTNSQNFADTSWAVLGGTTKGATNLTDPSNTNTACNVTWSAGGGSKYFYGTRTSSAGTYTISFYVKSSSGSKFRLYDGVSGSISSDFTATSSFQRFSYTFTQSSGTGGFYGILSASDGSAGDIIVAFAQFEAGTYSTTYIPTTTASATRIADSFTRSNIYTNGLISSIGGTWFVELRNNIIYQRDAFVQSLYVGDNINGIGSNGFAFVMGSGASRPGIRKYVGGVETIIYTTTTDTTKIVIKWNGTTADVFANGIKVISATSFTSTILEFLVGRANDVPRYIQQMALFPTPLSDDQCVALTSDFTEGESVIESYERYVNINGGAVENLNTITNLIQNLK